MLLNTPEELIADIRAGKMVILMDDEDRENEGDLVMAAEHITPAAINFMATHGRGLICLTITQERNDQLKLWQQSGQNHSPFNTAFTVSIEAATGVSTGISASDRATTIKAAIAKDARPSDLVQPGHIFPIVAREGGVLTRAGHTEASTDLARLAGLEPAGVIVEILQEDGSMARRPELEQFAQKHGIKIGTVADLIAYRLSKEQTITKTASAELPTAYGTFKLNTYQSIYKPSRLHFALSKGDINPETPTFVRVHVQNALSDLFHATLPDRTYTLQDALQQLAREESGVVVVLDAGEDYQAIESRIRSLSTPEDNKVRPDEPHLRTYGIGAQILVAEGVQKMRLLSSPYKFTSLSGYHLEVSEYLSI